MQPEVFTTTKMSDGTEVQILQLMPYMLWRAIFRQAAQKEKEYDTLPFIIEQLLRIDGKQLPLQQIGEMDISDYMKIQEIVSVMIDKPALF